jgi:hypothetical protein
VPVTRTAQSIQAISAPGPVATGVRRNQALIPTIVRGCTVAHRRRSTVRAREYLCQAGVDGHANPRKSGEFTAPQGGEVPPVNGEIGSGGRRQSDVGRMRRSDARAGRQRAGRSRPGVPEVGAPAKDTLPRVPPLPRVATRVDVPRIWSGPYALAIPARARRPCAKRHHDGMPASTGSHREQ